MITAAWLRLIPAPRGRACPWSPLYADAAAGAAAIERVIGGGLRPAALEYLDAPALGARGAGFPGTLPASGAFMVIAEADGSQAEAQRLAGEVARRWGEGASELLEPRGAF